MRNLKKVLALVIAFSMMLSVVAFAGYNDVAEDADYAGAVELLSALEIFEGDENGNFNPDKTVSRAEMAALICRATGLEEMAEASKGATAFTDVAASHWASGYVNVASSNGIINGIGDGKFAPDATLTYPQAVKMIVYALGFQLMAEDNGGWDAGSVYVANKYKVTEGAAVNATRGNLAILLANAMSTPMMDKTTYGANAEYEVLNGKNDKEYRTLLTNMDIYIATGVVGQKDADKIEFTLGEDSDDGEFKVSKKKNYEFEIGASAIAAYTYQQVDAYVKKAGRNYEVVAVVPSTVGETFTLLSDDIKAINGTEVEYYVDAANSNKTKKITVSSKLAIEYNKGAETKVLKDFEGDEDVVLTFVENTSDDEFDVLVATKYTSDRIDYIDANNDKLTLKNLGRTITFDFEDEDATIILADEQGNILTLDDFAKDDVVAIVADNTNPARYTKYIEIIKLANAAVTGTIDEAYVSNKKTYVVIDGADYINDTAETLQAGDEGIFYIGLTGKIIDFDGNLTGANYGFVLEGAKAAGSFSADKWQIKVLTKEDGIVTFDIADKFHDGKDFADYIKNFKLDAEGKKFLWEGAEDQGAAYRLIDFDVNSKGEIKELKVAEGDATNLVLGTSQYREGTQKLGSASLEDDVVIFNVAGADVDDAKVAAIDFLVDESTYAGFALKDDDGEYSAVVITGLESRFSAENGFAIVTKVSEGKDEEGDAVTKISYVQNEEEGVLTLDEDATEALGNTADLDEGDVFMFVADAAGVVSEYIIIATYDEKAKALEFANKDVTKIEAALKVGSDETDLVLGYIENDRRITKSKGEVITVAGAEYVVPAAAYKYTYNTIGRKAGIEVSDFMFDAEYCEVEYDKDDKATGYAFAIPVLVRLVDGDVVDVYSVNDAKKIETPAALK